MKKVFEYFTKFEWFLYTFSLIAVIVGFFVFDRHNYLFLVISIVGVFYLAFCAKGKPVGQLLVIAFSILYGIVSYYASYYGEMITYIGMTGSLAVISLIVWLNNPTSKKDNTVKINKLSTREWLALLLISGIVSVMFYFILKMLHNENLVMSTLSVTTSFLASYLSLRRSKYYAIAYALNDVILIILWAMLSPNNVKYINLVICFAVFLVNDVYGFIAWHKRDLATKDFE